MGRVACVGPCLKALCWDQVLGPCWNPTAPMAPCCPTGDTAHQHANIGLPVHAFVPKRACALSPTCCQMAFATLNNWNTIAPTPHSCGYCWFAGHWRIANASPRRPIILRAAHAGLREAISCHSMLLYAHRSYKVDTGHHGAVGAVAAADPACLQVQEGKLHPYLLSRNGLMLHTSAGGCPACGAEPCSVR